MNGPKVEGEPGLVLLCCGHACAAVVRNAALQQGGRGRGRLDFSQLLGPCAVGMPVCQHAFGLLPSCATPLNQQGRKGAAERTSPPLSYWAGKRSPLPGQSRSWFPTAGEIVAKDRAMQVSCV